MSWHVARARQAEAAGFDLVFIADSQFITADSPPHFLSRLEPLTLLMWRNSDLDFSTIQSLQASLDRYAIVADLVEILKS